MVGGAGTIGGVPGALEGCMSYRIVDVTVVDPRHGTLTPHQDVTVSGDRIVAVGATAGRPRGGDVDGAGRFAVPGYVDMHAHPLNQADPADALALMLTHGITGFRQMSGTPALLARRRTGRLDLGPLAPRLVAMPGDVLTPMNAGTPAAAAAEVAAQADAGADFVKAALISADVLPAAQQEAARRGIPVLGHLPAGVDPRAASRAGFRPVEHIGPGLGVVAGCSCVEEQVRAETPPGPRLPSFRIPFADRIAPTLMARIVVNPALRTSAATFAAIRHALDTFDEDRARDLAQRFAADGTWNYPTLIRIKTQQLCASAEFPADPDLRWIAPGTHAVDVAEDGREVRQGVHHPAARDVRGAVGDTAADHPHPRRGGRRHPGRNRRRRRRLGRSRGVAGRRVRPARRGRAQPPSHPADGDVRAGAVPGHRGHGRDRRRGEGRRRRAPRRRPDRRRREPEHGERRRGPWPRALRDRPDEDARRTHRPGRLMHSAAGWCRNETVRRVLVISPAAGHAHPGGGVTEIRPTTGVDFRRRRSSHCDRSPNVEVAMKYVMLVYQGDAQEQQAALSEEEQKQVWADYQGITTTPGVTSLPPLGASENATTVRVEAGRTLTTDGPFVGMKESVGSLFILEADDLDAAIEVASRVPAARYGGAVEIRLSEVYW